MQFVESASASLLLGLRSWATIPGLILSFKEQKSIFFSTSHKCHLQTSRSVCKCHTLSERRSDHLLVVSVSYIINYKVQSLVHDTPQDQTPACNIFSLTFYSAPSIFLYLSQDT